MNLDSVQPHDIDAYLLQLKHAQHAPHTVAKHYTILRAFWNWCIREGLTENKPFAKIEKPKAPNKFKPALIPDGVESILRACEGKHWLRLRDKALILLLLDTGLRIHEAHQLRVEDGQLNTLILNGIDLEHLRQLMGRAGYTVLRQCLSAELAIAPRLTICLADDLVRQSGQHRGGGQTPRCCPARLSGNMTCVLWIANGVGDASTALSTCFIV